MTAADPPPPAASLPPLSFAVYRVTFACPNCGKPRAFATEPARPHDPATWPAKCECGTYLGQYVIGPGRMRQLRLAAPD